MSHGEVCRCGSNPALLWLWHRPGAVAPIRPLAWEPPYATGVALKRPKTHTHTHKNKKTKKQKKRKKNRKDEGSYFKASAHGTGKFEHCRAAWLAGNSARADDLILNLEVEFLSYLEISVFSLKTFNFHWISLFHWIRFTITRI